MSGRALDELLADDPVVLVDVGARGGTDPRWRGFEQQLSVVGFEPDPKECARLNDEVGELPYPSRFLPYALGGEDRDDVPFYVNNWPVAPSVYEPNDEFIEQFPHARMMLAGRETKMISTSRLDTVAAREAVSPNLIKLDVEGAELDVLRGGEETLAKALMLDVEVEFQPVFRGQPLFGEVDQHLRDRGWSLLGLRRNSWRRTAEGFTPQPGYGGQIVSADALYFHRELIDQQISQATALKLAVILGAYRQFDFALEILRRPELDELAPVERAEVAHALAPDPGPMWRLLTRLLARGDAERRRAWVDALQRGEATVWHDPYHF